MVSRSVLDLSRGFRRFLVFYWLVFDVTLVVCAFRRCCSLVDMNEVVVLLHSVAEHDFFDFHVLSFGHQIGLCLHFRCGYDSVARDVLHFVVWAFDDDSI